LATSTKSWGSPLTATRNSSALFRDILRFDSRSNGNGFRLGLDYFSHHRTGPEMSWAEADKTPTLGKNVFG